MFGFADDLLDSVGIVIIAMLSLLVRALLLDSALHFN